MKSYEKVTEGGWRRIRIRITQESTTSYNGDCSGINGKKKVNWLY